MRVKLAALGAGGDDVTVLVKEFSATERLDRFEMAGIASQLLSQRGAGSIRELRRRGLHPGKDGPVPVERLLKLIVALAPIKLLRNQRVDVGVDREMPGCVVACRHSKDERDQDSGKGKPRAESNNRYNNACQHKFSF